MTDQHEAVARQLANMEKRTGKSVAELNAIVKASGLVKHGELVAMLKSSLGMGHGDANLLVHLARQSDGASATAGLSSEQVLDQLYTGPKAALRPIHDKLLKAMRTIGSYEEAPKKKYVSYRRKKQFVMIGPATKAQVEVGLNVKGLPKSPRLAEQPAGQMCQYKLRLTGAAEVDAELIDWIRAAWEAAG